MKKILFVCGRNQKRSPTAETIFRNDPDLEVRSAGVSDNSRRKVKEADLQWADFIMVMEQKHASRLRSQFNHLQKIPEIEVLDIPDDYEFMDPELIALLETCVRGRLEQ